MYQMKGPVSGGGYFPVAQLILGAFCLVKQNAVVVAYVLNIVKLIIESSNLIKPFRPVPFPLGQMLFDQIMPVPFRSRHIIYKA